MFFKDEAHAIGYIFIYIAFFGFSDYIVAFFGLKGFSYMLFYTVILIIGIGLIYYHKNTITNSSK